LDRIDCRRADSDEERETIFRLRYQAYLRDGSISANSTKSFSDPYDEMGNVFLFGLYIDGDLASSVRIHVASKDQPVFPSLEVFPDILRPELDAGKVIVDPTRLSPTSGLLGAIADCRMSQLGFAGWRPDTSAPSICSRP